MHSREFAIARIVRFALMAIVTGVSCGETTGPETIDPPAGVAAALISPSTARITWTASAQSARVNSYNVFRNGAKVAEVLTTSHVDEGLVELNSYKYAVSANGRAGIVSALSADSPSASVIPTDITGPRVAATTPAAAAAAVPRATTIRATFSEAMTPETINASTFLVRTASGTEIAGTVTYLPATFTAEFVPATSLPNATGMAVTITTSVRDQSGNAMTVAFGYEFVVRDEIAPAVSSVSPTDLATGVSVGTPAIIVFSKPMDAPTINSSSVTLRLTATGVAVSGNISYDAASRAVTLIPAAPLNPGASYTAEVSTAVKDFSGNGLPQAFASLFFTAPVVAPPPGPPPPPPPPNEVPPVVLASTPANGSKNAEVTSPTNVTFSKVMDAATISGSTFTLTVGGAPVSGTVTYDPSLRVASFLPSAGLLAEGQNYVATVTTGIRDASGNRLASDFVFAFTTATPAIVSRTPSPGATGLARTTTIQVKFSKAMEASTINGRTFTLSSGGTSSQVVGSVTYDAGTRIASFTPNAPLAANRRYTATITTGVKDAAGDALVANETFSFATGFLPAAPDMAGLIGLVIGDDSSGGCIEGASVRVVQGQGSGQNIFQQTPCDVWGYYGGFTFENLIPGVEMILQASAPGYLTSEKKVVPSLGAQGYVELTLDREK